MIHNHLNNAQCSSLQQMAEIVRRAGARAGSGCGFSSSNARRGSGIKVDDVEPNPTWAEVS
jgi:hypothetical protein